MSFVIGDLVRQWQYFTTPVMLLMRVVQRGLIMRGQVEENGPENNNRSDQPECIGMLFARARVMRLMVMTVVRMVMRRSRAHQPNRTRLPLVGRKWPISHRPHTRPEVR